MVFTSFVSLVSLRKNPCATRQNPHNFREIYPNGDLLIHHFVVPLLRWRRLFDKSKFDAEFAIYQGKNLTDGTAIRKVFGALSYFRINNSCNIAEKGN